MTLQIKPINQDGFRCHEIINKETGESINGIQKAKIELTSGAALVNLVTIAECEIESNLVNFLRETDERMSELLPEVVDLIRIIDEMNNNDYSNVEVKNKANCVREILTGSGHLPKKYHYQLKVKKEENESSN